MIAMHEYTPKEIDYIYSAVEEAATSGKPIDEVKMNLISQYVHPGDFYLKGTAANGLVFTFDGLRWIENGRIYSCLLQPLVYHEHILPVWKPVITFDDRDHTSSGRLSMLKKENRYINTDQKWAMRRLDEG